MTSQMNKQPSLLFCVIMDLLGSITYIIPGIGETADIIWAPISGYLFYKTFGGRKAAIGGLFNFAEELLLFTDIIPSFTIMWLIQRFYANKPLPILPL